MRHCVEGSGPRGSSTGALVSFAADSMPAAIFRVALKAIGERARSLTLPGPGVRQVLPFYVAESQMLSSLDSFLDQLLRRNIRSSLMRRIFPDHRGEPSEARLLEALARHGKCGAGDSMDPSVATATVTKLVHMGSENTAEDRTDAIIARLETFFENRSAESVFREPDGSYKRGPARVITRSLVDGLKPAGLKDKVERELDILEGCKSDPDLVFEVVLSAATSWRTVEHDAKFHKRQADRGKSGAGANAADPQSSRPCIQRQSRGQPTCWTCGESGHRSAECVSAGKGKPGDGSTPSRGTGGGAGKAASHPPGRQKRAAAPPAKGTPAAREGSQSKPATPQGAAVGGRAALPADGSALAVGADPPVVLPDPRPPGVAAPAGAAPPASAVVPSWRAVAPGGTSGFVSQEVAIRAAARERLVDLSIPGAAKPAACPVKAVLDSGAGVSTIPPGIADKLQAMFPDVQVLRWATVDKERFAIVSTFLRLEYLLWGGVHIHTDHRNLAYIFNPEACVSSVPKTTAQRLENWKAVLGQYDYTIQHIEGPSKHCRPFS
eukprot:g20089.t1